mgnify:CR=1 FL=1
MTEDRRPGDDLPDDLPDDLGFEIPDDLSGLDAAAPAHDEVPDDLSGLEAALAPTSDFEPQAPLRPTLVEPRDDFGEERFDEPRQPIPVAPVQAPAPAAAAPAATAAPAAPVMPVPPAFPTARVSTSLLRRSPSTGRHSPFVSSRRTS